jgi:hypothetical protein
MCEDSESRPPEVLPSKTLHSGEDKAPERWVSFLGFVIVTKADLLAAAAFLLSLVSVIYQLSSWIKGPSPSVYPPDLVYVFFDQYANNRIVVRFASQLSAVNTADPGHDAIVRDISLEATAPGLDITQEWLSFVTVQRDGTRLLVTPKEAAHPFPVVAGGSVSYAISFAPLEEACPGIDAKANSAPPAQVCDHDRQFVSDTDFLNKIAKIDSLELKFRVRFVGVSKALIASCTIPIGVAFRQYVSENDWFAARCTSPAEDGSYHKQR